MSNLTMLKEEHDLRREEIKEREYRDKLLMQRKLICEKIHEIELVYDDKTKEEQNELDKTLLEYGELLVELVPPRKSMGYLIKKNK
ncbi:MAG TPA: hypothetical protein VK121_04680 [Pseudogracilibacillus sp.]|nr:hypothetical protein [Pseudogracilibacillus sp.]